jgi:cytidylate kinase
VDPVIPNLDLFKSPESRTVLLSVKKAQNPAYGVAPGEHLSFLRGSVIRIITIEREYGSGAAQIAAKLASRLGWKLWDQQLTQEIALHAHCEQSAVAQREERRDPLYQRLLKSFALGSSEGYRGGPPVEMLDSDSIFKISQRVVEQAASAGNCVIVGRGSQHFLQHRKDALRIFLYAPTADKVRRLVSEGNTQAKAEALVDTVDRERAAFIRNYFHTEWPNRPVYHAMINTAMGEDAVVEVILGFLKQASAQSAAEPVAINR